MLIDVGAQSASLKRIIAPIPGDEDAKPEAGPRVAEPMLLDVIRHKCPHFNAWLSQLERSGAGSEESGRSPKV